jgi:hypothetical protein
MRYNALKAPKRTSAQKKSHAIANTGLLLGGNPGENYTSVRILSNPQYENI